MPSPSLPLPPPILSPSPHCAELSGGPCRPDRWGDGGTRGRSIRPCCVISGETLPLWASSPPPTSSLLSSETEKCHLQRSHSGGEEGTSEPACHLPVRTRRGPKSPALLIRDPVRSHWSPAREHTDPPLGDGTVAAQVPLGVRKPLGAGCPDAGPRSPRPQTAASENTLHRGPSGCLRDRADTGARNRPKYLKKHPLRGERGAPDEKQNPLRSQVVNRWASL